MTTFLPTTMWIGQVVLLLLSFALGGWSIALHNYAPAHEYKSSDYSFSYGVKDFHTGDVKHQWEKKDGDVVRGHYSVLEPDGSVRTVDYTAGGKSGFNAVVKHSGPSHHPIQKSPSSHNHLIIKPKVIGEEPEFDYTNLKQSYKTEVEYEPTGEEDDETPKNEEENELPPLKHTYVYVPQEELGEESQHENSNLEYDYKKNELPVDLNLLKGRQSPDEKLVPVDVSQLNPVEIDLSDDRKYSNQVLHPSHQLSQEEIGHFLKEYYHSGSTGNNNPQLETGFKPITSKPANIFTQPSIPQTYKSNKKPVTTPGLRNFASKSQNLKRSNPRRQHDYPRDHLPRRASSRLHRETADRGHRRFKN